MINTQTLKGNLINQDYSTAFTLNQGDKGVPFKVELLENGTPYTLQSSDIITIEWLKPNGNPFLQEGDISYGTTYIEFTTPEAIAQYSGSGSFNIIITNGDVRKGTIRREYKVVSTSMKPGSVSEDIVTDAITELRSLSAEIASTVQNNQELINNNTAATKSDIATVNSSLDNKANKNEVGAPLTATNISEMTDKTKVYVNTTDGNWYSWNGSDWVIGGVYNSIAIGNGTVTPVKTSFLKQTKNLFDKFTVKKGYYWNVSTGEQVNSDFSYVIIPCEKGKKYIATGTSYNVCLFNSQGTRVGADNNSNGMANCIISTESYSEVAYFILSFRHATYPIDTYMVVEGEVLPSEYIEYGFKFDGKILFDNNSNILNVKKDGTGDFTRVYDAIKYAEQYANKDNVFNIQIYDTSTNHKGTAFDILEEMGGDSYLSTITNTSNNQMGMPLKDYINLIGIGKVKLYAYLPDSCTLAQSTCFSTIDIFGESTLENLTIEIKNGRYAVHDESNNKKPNRKHRFKKCKFIHLGNKSGLWSAPHAYASGTSAGCIYEYEDCIYDASASGGYPWDMHNYAPQQGSIISFNGCEMIKSPSQAVSIKLGFNGYSPITTDPVAYETCFNDVYIKNIIADGTIQVAPEVNSYTCTNNFRLHNFTGLIEDIKEDFIKS